MTDDKPQWQDAGPEPKIDITGEQALARIVQGMGNPSMVEQLQALMVQLQIAKTMRSVVQERGYNPQALTSMSQADKPRGTGWRDAKPLESPPGQDHIRRLTEAFQPHGLGNSENPLGKAVEEAVAKFRAQAAEEKEKPKD